MTTENDTKAELAKAQLRVIKAQQDAIYDWLLGRDNSGELADKSWLYYAYVNQQRKMEDGLQHINKRVAQ